jgi:2-keto-4-pentenoate hydratase
MSPNTDGAPRAGSPAETISAGDRRTAELLRSARLQQRVLDAPLPELAAASLDGAYAVQRAVTAERLAAGERVVGWKLGYTSTAMREQMGISEPNLGPLTDRMLLASGDVLPAAAIQPRVEPEIAVRLTCDLAPGCTREEVIAAGEAYAALEVVDSVWRDYRFTLVDNTADGSSAAWVVLGDRLVTDDWDRVTVELAVDGDPVARSTGAAASGHPAEGIRWLADQVRHRYGTTLRVGDVIITGGLTSAPSLAPGSRIEAHFQAPEGDRATALILRR